MAVGGPWVRVGGWHLPEEVGVVEDVGVEVDRRTVDEELPDLLRDLLALEADGAVARHLLGDVARVVDGLVDGALEDAQLDALRERE